MNILIVNCSPVKNGATAEIVSLVSTYTKENNQVRCICMNLMQRYRKENAVM